MPVPAAPAAQSGLSAALALAVFAVWRAPGWPFDRKAALLVAAAPLATPCLWHYDAAPTGLAALFLLRAGTLPVSDGLRGLLWLPAWIGPGLLIWTVALMPGPQPPAAWLLLPGMALTLAIALWPRAACPHPPDFARPSAGCQR
ncbi:hypothetical protein [Rhodovulum sp. BSW8]|uniref:hypothetical protein n=1 Tax=Rhodovulum sp. BSW8 TaxID=2259645 RepID=UPI001058E5BE|nr:hypothetical protein [Rhodovulum sp. BSW8]